MSKISRKGFPLVLCAPSGAGKTTLTRKLCQDFPLAFSVSCTTRPPREGEVDGRDYFFLDHHTFDGKRKKGEFAEWAFVHGNYYGTPIAAVQDTLNSGQDMLFDIDVQGAAQLANTLPHAIFVFIFPPSLHELEQRLHQRGTENNESILRRITNARLEIQQARWFQYWIINEDVDEAYTQLKSVYIAASLRPCLCAPLPGLILES